MLGREVRILRHFTKLATVVLIALPATAAFAHAEISDPVLAQKISVLLRDVFTGTNEQTTAAQAKIRDLFRARGLPTIAQVGNDTSYDFVLLASLGQPLSFEADVLPAVRAAARKNEIPSDAAIFYLARFRLERMKESADKHAPLNPSLRDQIESLYKIDQAVRQPAGFDKQKMIQTDRKLAPVLKNIFEKYGLPTFAMVGTRAAGEFVIMVQHQSPEFRAQVLPKLKAAIDEGQADPQSFALVYDRSQRDQGKKQLYGTQLECKAGQNLREAPIEDEAHVNERRAKLGLMRVQLYARLTAESMPQFCAAEPA